MIIRDSLELYKEYQHPAREIKRAQYRVDWYKAAEKFPTSAFKDYLGDLDHYVNQLGEIVNGFWDRSLRGIIKRQLRDSSFTQDDIQDQLASELARLEERLGEARVTLNMSQKVKQMTRGVRRKAVNNFQHEVQRILGPNFHPMVRGEKLSRFVQQSVQSNVKLIKSISSDYHDALTREIYTGIQQGIPIEDLKVKLDHSFRVTASRTRVIAMDQTNSLHSAINRAQHKDMNLKSFTWWAVMDDKTRASHAARHGHIYKWQNPPGGDTPGGPICCRCYASPVESELKAYANTGIGQAMML